MKVSTKNYKPYIDVLEGNYGFVVSESSTTESSTGKEMISLRLAVNTDVGIITVYDNLVSHEKCVRHIGDFIQSTGRGKFAVKGESADVELTAKQAAGAKGLARFRRNERGYLEVHYYLHNK